MGCCLGLGGLLLARLRRLLGPLLGLALLSCLLGAAAGPVLEAAGERGALRLTLVLTSEGGGMETVEAMTGYLSSLEDMAGYCTFLSAEPRRAAALLERGEATAVLCLPEHFLQDVLSGKNTPPTLRTAPGRPLEAWLAGWLGESAAGLLTTAQAGIYAVLEIYDALEDPALSREDVVWGINLKYAGAVLDRGSLFRSETVRATGALRVDDHYTLGTLACLLLLLAPLFAPLYGGADWKAFLRRAGAAGVPAALPTAMALGLTWLVYAALFWSGAGGLSAAQGGGFLAAAGPAALCALLAAGWTGVCCTLCASPGGAGLLALGAVGVNALAAGCLLPPALLPAALRRLGAFSPLTWMRAALAAPLGYDAPPAWPLALAGGLCAAAALLIAAARRKREG